MADARVEIQLNAKDNASSVFKKVGSSAADLGKTLAVGVAAGGAAVAAGLGVAVSAAASFEQRMSAVKAVSGASAEEMAQLSAKALQLGKDTSFSANEAARGLEELVKGGIPIADIMSGAAEATLNLAAAGGVDLATAAEIAAGAINTFNLAGTDMEHVADLIAGAASATSIDVNDFRLSMAAAGSVVNLVGGSFDDLAVGITAMGKAGIKGSDAGTSLKTMLLNLQPTTEKQVDLFKELGIVTRDGANQFFTAEGKAKSFAGIAGVLQNAMQGMTEQQRLASLEVMFGSDAIRAAAVFTKQGAEGFENLAREIEGIKAVDMARERLNNLAGDMEQLKGSVEVAAITLGSAFLEGTRGATQALTGFINNAVTPFIATHGPALAAAAATAGEKIGEFFSTVAAFAAEHGPAFVAGVGDTVSGLGTFASGVRENAINALNELGTRLDEIGAQWAPWAAEAGAKGEAVGDALSGVHGIASALEKFLRGDFSGGVEDAGKAFENFGTAADTLVQALRETLQPALDETILKFQGFNRELDLIKQEAEKRGVFDDLSTSMDNVAKSIEAIERSQRITTPGMAEFSKSVGMSEIATKLLGVVLKAMVEDVIRIPANMAKGSEGLLLLSRGVELLTTKFAEAQKVIVGWMQSLPATVGNALSQVGPAFSALGTTVHGALDEMGAAAGETFSQMGTTVRGAVDEMGPAVGEAFNQMGTTVRGALDQMGTNVGETFSQMGTTINNKLTEFAGTVGPLATQIVDAIVAELTAMKDRAATAMDAVGTAISGALATIAGTAGAAAVAVGTGIMDGISGGINSKVRALSETAANAASAIINAAKAALQASSPSKVFIEIGEDVVEGLVIGIDENADDAADIAQEMAEDVTEAVADHLGDFEELGEEAAEGLADGIEMGGGQAVAAARTLADDISDALNAGLGKTKVADAAFDPLRGTVAGAMQELGSSIEDVLRNGERALSDIGYKAGRAWQEASDQAGRAIGDVLSAASDSVRNLRDNFDLGREIRGARAEMAAQFAMDDLERALQRSEDAIERAQLIDASTRDRTRFREEEDVTRSRGLDDVSVEKTRGLDDLALEKARRREDAEDQRRLAIDIAKAKTDADRVEAINRASEARDELLHRRRLEDADRVERRKAEDDERAERRKLEDAERAYRRNREDEDRKYREDLAEDERKHQRSIDELDRTIRNDQEQKRQDFEDRLEEDALTRQIRRIEHERDERVDAINHALDEKRKAIEEDANRERTKLMADLQQKISDLREEFVAKLPALTAAAQDVVGGFLNRLEEMADTLISKFHEAFDAANAIPTDITVTVNTVGSGFMPMAGESAEASAARNAGGEASGGGGLSSYAQREEFRENNPGWIVEEPTPGNFVPVKLAAGGIVDKPTLALIGEAGPEAVVPLGNGMGIDYDRLGQAVARALHANPPRVALEDVRSGLLRIGARNGGTVGLA